MSLDLGYRFTVLMLAVVLLPINIVLVVLWAIAWLFMRFVMKDGLGISLKRFLYEFWTEV